MASKRQDKKAADNAEFAGAQREAARRRKNNMFVFVGTVVVLVITIVAFVFVPAIVPSAAGYNESALTFGSWDKKPIRYVPGGYFARMREQYEQYGQMYGMSNDIQIWQAAFQAQVERTAALDIMTKTGWEPPKSAVDKQVAALPQFKDADTGKFSTALFRKMSDSDKLTLWKQVRDDMLVTRYTRDASGIRSSEAEAAFMGGMASSSRSFDLAAFPLSDYPDSEVRAFAEANGDVFKVVHLSQITMTDEKDAKAVLEELKNGTAVFGEAAKTHSSDSYAEKSGDAGTRLAHEMESLVTDEAERAAVVSLAAGDVPVIAKTPTGWTIFRAEEDPKPLNLDDAANLAKVRAYMMENERGKIEDYMLAQAQDFVTKAAELGFDALLNARGINKQTFGPLPINYGDSSMFSNVSSFGVPALSAASTNENFWKTAWQTKTETCSAPIVLGDNVLVLYPLKSEPDTDGKEDAEESDSDPTKQVADMYKSWWASNDAGQAVSSAIMKSPKLKDNFLSTYFSLFSGSSLGL